MRMEHWLQEGLLITSQKSDNLQESPGRPWVVEIAKESSNLNISFDHEEEQKTRKISSEEATMVNHNAELAVIQYLDKCYSSRKGRKGQRGVYQRRDGTT